MPPVFLTVVTISFRDWSGLSATLASLDAQEVLPGHQYEHIIVASGLTDMQKSELLNQNTQVWRRFMFDVDNSLYNAMNIGLDAARGTHVLFLNGADRLHGPDSLRIVLDNIQPGRNAAFRVLQFFGDDNYIRPGKAWDAMATGVAHCGFVAVRDGATGRFSETRPIDADSHWISACKKAHPIDTFDTVISAFQLGGISNMPSWRTIKLRYRHGGAKSGCAELIKFLLRSGLGTRRYYRLLARRADYTLT